ncbi:MAG: hypothetical protein MZW92_44475 [Comamonadaceae bacterium]|nr:hypothetical protein [Comamonadaceae bacterium]
MTESPRARRSRRPVKPGRGLASALPHRAQDIPRIAERCRRLVTQPGAAVGRRLGGAAARLRSDGRSRCSHPHPARGQCRIRAHAAADRGAVTGAPVHGLQGDQCARRERGRAADHARSGGTVRAQRGASAGHQELCCATCRWRAPRWLATISFAALKTLGDRHVADCARVAASAARTG